MPASVDAIFAFAAAAAVAWLLVPVAEAFAWRIGAIDLPSERSLHVVPTPRLSGIAILVAVCASGAIFLPWDEQTRAILLGAIVIATVGMADDIFDLPPLVKLIGQIVAAVIPVSAGVTVDVFTLPFVGGVDPGGTELFELPLVGHVDLGELGTVLGIVAMANVVNLIDGVDGLASGVCLISAATLAIVALSLERNPAGILAAITAGGALGFLRHGFPPASSFMGDTGSNLLGYLLGVAAVQGALKTNAVVALAFPLLVLAVPILDTGFVVAKRLKYRRPIYEADTWHFHHRMANIGFSQRRTLAYLYGWTLIMAAVALALRFVPYSDDRGNLDPGWAVLMAAILIFAVAASFYVIYVLEILKLRRFRFRQVAASGAPPVADAVDREVEHELETGEFREPNPETGEFEQVDPPSATGPS
jgi:UDP-GlcNAc:undecaprenyl-phosphate GlcNAc-1-phosphate transferase